jgi:alkylhydroperoxidase/carboxymuconolactone decarboxylase family protein YurZ
MSDAAAAADLLAMASSRSGSHPWLEHRTAALVHLAGLVALPSAPASYHAAVAAALAEGASEDDVLGVLVCLAPVVGTARVIQAAPDVALALGYDVDSAFEGPMAARDRAGLPRSRPVSDG